MPKVDGPHVEQKQNNLQTNKKFVNHKRYSSAPSQNTSKTNAAKRVIAKKNTAKKESCAKDDAEKTFESFVTYENFYKKDDNDACSDTNDSSQSKGEYEDRETYFRSRESKRIDSAVKKAQRAYYETYLKELQQNTKALVPHPPSQRPKIRKPVNTNRINRSDHYQYFSSFCFLIC